MTILTQNQLRQSIADAFSRSVEHAYKDLLDAAVRAEREACAQIADAEASIEGIAQRIAAAIRARGNT